MKGEVYVGRLSLYTCGLILLLDLLRVGLGQEALDVGAPGRFLAGIYTI